MEATPRTALVVERPGAFREGLLKAIEAAGWTVQASDDAIDALSRLEGVAPGCVLVSSEPGVPGAASVCRIVRRKLAASTVWLLFDDEPSAGDPDPSIASGFLLRGQALARLGEVLGPLPAADAPAAVPATGGAPAPVIAPPPAPVVVPTPATGVAPRAAVSIPEPAPDLAAREPSDPRLVTIERLVDQGQWSRVETELGPPEQVDRLPPALALLFAIAHRERPGGGIGTGGERSLDADALAIHALGSLLGVGRESAIARVVAKRALHRIPRIAPARLQRISLLAVLVAGLLGAVAGWLVGHGHRARPAARAAQVATQ